ncbi:anthranilate synthase component I family protein [Rathayibacter toxicus]|nr:anthranilate synthase component I family protein [Rathayibacter toxicus]
MRLPWVDPERAYLALFAEADASFWLDTATGIGHSFLGACAFDEVLLVDGTGDLSRALAQLETEVGVDRALGWYGWISYEASLVAPPTVLPNVRDPPTLALLRGDPVLEFDHTHRTLYLISADLAGEEASRLAHAVMALANSRDESTQPAAPEPALGVSWRHDAEQYGALIERCQAAIRAGEAYQLCLTNEVLVTGCFDPVEAYRRLRRSSPSHHGGLIRVGEHALASASPERFLTVDADGKIATHPIKGTRARGLTPEQDAALRAELLCSVKERAENVMIVDLMRNDLARIAVPASVAVERLLEVESYPQVHQLVSEVSARRAPGVGVAELLAATFPAGSMTGAPKRRARELLGEWEAGTRGIYSGAFGRFGSDGSLDLAVTIRTLVLERSCARLGTGGGITALSVAEEEIEETRLKARALLAVLGIAEDDGRVCPTPGQ